MGEATCLLVFDEEQCVAETEFLIARRKRYGMVAKLASVVC